MDQMGILGTFNTIRLCCRAEGSIRKLFRPSEYVDDKNGYWGLFYNVLMGKRGYRGLFRPLECVDGLKGVLRTF